MIKRLLNYFRKKPELVIVKERPQPVFSTDDLRQERELRLEQALDNNFKDLKSFVADQGAVKFAMDNQINLKANFAGNTILPTAQVLWYANQTFIGYQLCAMLAQQWLISKCCLMPAKDAVRNGYELAVDDGTEVDPEVLEAIKKADARYKFVSPAQFKTVVA